MPDGRVPKGGAAGPWLVGAATCFNVVLCYANTAHWLAVGPLHIVGVSLAILGTGLFFIRDRIDGAMAQGAALVAAVVVALKLLNPALDLKILFDLAIAPIFFLLGRGSSVAAADRLLMILMAIVIALGVVEWLAPDTFQTWFDILGFYTSKGAVGVDDPNYSGTRFFASAQRDDAMGRMVLPWLFGAHRVSSIFLEPVSMGNFPVISLAWLLTARLRWGAARWLMAFGTAFSVALPDSRLAVASCALMLGFRTLPLRGSAATAAGMPLLALAALLVLGWSTLSPGEAILVASDDFLGRAMFSGKLLASWDWPEWLALQTSAIYTLDTGYAYLVNNLSLPVAVLLWLSVGLAPLGRSDAGAMRGMLALYVATSLCVGASMLSIKTAALLWFLFGAADTAGRGLQPRLGA